MEKPKRKAPNGGMGRPKGTKNKLPRDLALKVVAIAEQLEAENKGLADEAEKDPQWFYTNFVKPMLPKEYKILGDETAPLVMRIERRIVDPANTDSESIPAASQPK